MGRITEADIKGEYYAVDRSYYGDVNTDYGYITYEYWNHDGTDAWEIRMVAFDAFNGYKNGDEWDDTTFSHSEPCWRITEMAEQMRTAQIGRYDESE